MTTSTDAARLVDERDPALRADAAANLATLRELAPQVSRRCGATFAHGVRLVDAAMAAGVPDTRIEDLQISDLLEQAQALAGQIAAAHPFAVAAGEPQGEAPMRT